MLVIGQLGWIIVGCTLTAFVRRIRNRRASWVQPLGGGLVGDATCRNIRRRQAIGRRPSCSLAGIKIGRFTARRSAARDIAGRRQRAGSREFGCRFGNAHGTRGDVAHIGDGVGIGHRITRGCCIAGIDIV